MIQFLCCIASYFVDDQKQRCQYLTHDEYGDNLKEHDHTFDLLICVRHARLYNFVDGRFYVVLISNCLYLFDNVGYHYIYIILKISNNYI
jgi:hypothetical protein